MDTIDQYNLHRFLGAQELFYKKALREIRKGKKESHWVWFIFPQLKGLGHSPLSNNYGISSIDEARAYLENPTSKKHLIEASSELLKHSKDRIFRKHKSAEEILGKLNAMKVRSSMTLFDLVMPNAIFADMLNAFYNGVRDELTLSMTASLQPTPNNKTLWDWRF